MEIYRAATIAEDGTLAIQGLPFAAGDKVEVIIRNRLEDLPLSGKYPVRGTLVSYIDPLEPVGLRAWEVLK